MNQIYCPYTNKKYYRNETNSEHIIPLSLGGANGFEIPVEKKFNARVGSEIDGKLANDFYMNLKRTKLKTKGHSKKEPSIIAKTAYLEPDNKRVRLEISRSKGINIWNPIEKEQLDFRSKVTFKNISDFNNMRTIRIRFIAKTALSAGYLLYGKNFINHVNHDEIRIIMNFNGNYSDPKLQKLSTTVDYQFNDDNNEIIKAFKFVCSAVGEYSSIGLVPLESSLAIFVGILGDYIGMLNVPCDSAKLLEVSERDWGVFACIQENDPIICTWKRLVDKIGNRINSISKKSNQSFHTVATN